MAVTDADIDLYYPGKGPSGQDRRYWENYLLKLLRADIASGGGGGTTVTTGTATLAFGATPKDSTTLAIAGQASILATSKVEAWIMGATTADNNEQSHLQAGALIRCVAGIPVAATGFTIYADAIAGRVTGDFTVKWSWI